MVSGHPLLGAARRTNASTGRSFLLEGPQGPPEKTVSALSEIPCAVVQCCALEDHTTLASPTADPLETLGFKPATNISTYRPHYTHGNMGLSAASRPLQRLSNTKRIAGEEHGPVYFDFDSTNTMQISKLNRDNPDFYRKFCL
ncbi:hypothetical protein Zmor_002862 [Zophobas morio]|uniref:Uncharacterized protein n=1 Tax=Zophobas morio TaxID=2755281 RepID=A0AA38HKQ3_9CUCU|nr:hypothetical protein Zmor_002862 [Zophobas morio]